MPVTTLAANSSPPPSWDHYASLKLLESNPEIEGMRFPFLEGTEVLTIGRPRAGREPPTVHINSNSIGHECCELRYEKTAEQVEGVMRVERTRLTGANVYIDGQVVRRAAVIADDQILSFFAKGEHKYSMKFTYNPRYAIKKSLGKGQSNMFLGEDRKDGQAVAIKLVEYKNGVTHSDVMEEINLMKAVNHPNIVHLLDTYELARDGFPHTQGCRLVMEYVEGKTLEKWADHRRVHENATPEDQDTKNKHILRQLCAAVEHLHGQRIIHRDIKGANIILSKDALPFLKLIDFGTAKRIQIEKATTYCGSSGSMAPEQYNANGRTAYTEKVDCWAVGMVLYDLTCPNGSIYYASKQNQERIRQEVRKDSVMFAEAKDFLLNLVCDRPRDRWTMEQALESDWMRDGGD
ncbi:kinase-like protein [Cylindrobasidium torrendii FP15055 ss-10]|uniref:Kinase-like protein n=1 Tax=Cylindrobasidium torrendii FP15055 ss-10 TaxID=1314674 RepID=A0A0D7B585_9AGAR|nr:kinase-like protein [Cylindrobasidium torrendii FP15055 ss-10]